MSAVATVGSTYALDAVATAGGLMTAASGLLKSLSIGWLLGALGLSYAAWFLGLRTNLAANHELLVRMGTSTNVLSKLAFELTGRMSPRSRQWASSMGYIATELGKESFYYGGAFGAAVVTPVSAADALAFLLGTNLAAAGYEYCLGRGTMALLARRSAHSGAAWAPRDYLRDFYGEVGPPEIATIEFLVRQMAGAIRGPVLCFGAGPTLHHVFVLAPGGGELHLGDHLEGNLGEIRRWLDRAPDAHDWGPFVRHTLICEGIPAPTDREVADREELTRRRVSRLVHVNGRRALGAPVYATVISAYSPDVATRTPREWADFMGRILDYVEPGGLLLTATLRRPRGYQVGGCSFPSPNVGERHLRTVVRARWGTVDGTIEVHQLAEPADRGDTGIVLAALRRPVDVPKATRTERLRHPNRRRTGRSPTRPTRG